MSWIKAATLLALLALLATEIPCSDAKPKGKKKKKKKKKYYYYDYSNAPSDSPSDMASSIISDVPSSVPSDVPTGLDLGDFALWDAFDDELIGPIPEKILFCKSDNSVTKYNLEYLAPEGTTRVMIELFNSEGKRRKKNVINRPPFMLKNFRVNDNDLTNVKAFPDLTQRGTYEVVATIQNHVDPTMKGLSTSADLRVVKKKKC